MFKYSVSLILYRPANAKGQYPIYIRITINRKQSYISTGHFIDPKLWDKKAEQVRAGHMQATVINPDITTRKQTIIKRIVDHQVKGENITASHLKNLVTAKADLHNIFEFVEAFAAEVEHKREGGTLENYRKHLKVLEQFHGSRSLAFEEITHDYLVKFESYLRNPIAGVREGLGGNYIHNIWKTIKTFFNAARKRGVTTCYPFSTYENPEYDAPHKDYLTLQELDHLEDVLSKTSNRTLKQTLTYFLLGCYSGLRLSDWQQFNYDQHVKDGRLYLRAKKNGEWVTMPVVGRLANHLEYVKAQPLIITEQEINRTLKNVGGIKKKITTHTGRHTFAITMCADQGISAETCSELMGITIKTCVENYYKITNRKIDKECLGAWTKKATRPGAKVQ
jgi:site-specific recombinase XerD